MHSMSCAEQQYRECRRSDATRKFRDPVGKHIAPGEAPGDRKAKRDSRIEMGSGDVSESVDHGKHDETRHPGRRHQATLPTCEMPCSRERNGRKDNAEGSDKLSHV